jgi:type IV pilus assembly protein PilB
MSMEDSTPASPSRSAPAKFAKPSAPASLLPDLRRMGLVPERPLSAAGQEDDAVVTLGWLSIEELGDARAFLRNWAERPSPETIPAEPMLAPLVPGAFALKHQVLPLRLVGKRMLIAHADTLSKVAATALLDEVALLVGRPALGWPVAPDMLRHAVADTYDPRSARGAINRALEREQRRSAPQIAADRRLRDAPIVDLVDHLIDEAVANGASDLHLDPQPGGLLVRLRVDGVLRDLMSVPAPLGPHVVRRIMLMAELNITDARRPQDGRFSCDRNGVSLDVRVAIAPTRHGEMAVLRLLRPLKQVHDLASMGMRPTDLRRFQQIFNAPHGLVLVTGPTGSGKSSTLYTTLQLLDRTELNVITVEDPIEYAIDRTMQIQVQPAVGLTFATALRSILRLDPDVIMIGEIRDAETLEIAMEAAMTGHLVFSTVHANCAASTIERMLELGASPQKITTSVVGIVAQRLVRRLCTHCRQIYLPGEAERSQLPDAMREPIVLSRGVGCPKCDQSGYHGRVGVYEVVELDDELAKAVHAGASVRELRRVAAEQGSTSLATDALAKALSGLTSLHEIERLLHAFSIETAALYDHTETFEGGSPC